MSEVIYSPEVPADCCSHPFGKYSFCFRATDAGIEVIRILHSARDIDQIAFK